MGPTNTDIATRTRLIEQLRLGCNTIEGLAAALGITDNAVRFHIATLERTEIIHRAGTVRDGRVGKPAVVYELTDFGEELQSRAYAPVLTACVEELATHMSEQQLLAFMRDVGLRLAANVAKPDGDLDSKVRNATEILEALGGKISITSSSAGTVIQGHACPIASAVVRQPVTCTVIQTLLDELLGLPVTELCNHTERPRCKFLVGVGND
jgi:predicted ArsR family transcriptional regulator